MTNHQSSIIDHQLNVSSIGLGKLGLCSAASFAGGGHHVIGVDSNREQVRALEEGRCPVDERGLPALLDRCRQNMEFTGDYHRAVRDSDISVITVPTPSDSEGRFSNAYIEAVLDRLAPALKARQTFHVVDIVSTVMPGTCERVFKPRLERLTGKVCGRDFGLVYNPEFVALGSVLQDFLHPDLVLIGASDERSAQVARELHRSTVRSNPHYAIMSLTNAEITKLSLNCYVTMKISFANELAAVCERIPGADVDVVTSAIGVDTRVGRRYLKGGLGFGGPCFPRDNLAFQRCAEDAGIPVHLSPRVVKVNNEIVRRLFDMIGEHARARSTVALLGLSYKPGTHIVEESQPVMLAQRLLDAGYIVRMHDPKALQSASEVLRGRGVYCDDPYDAVSGASVVVVLTPWPEYHDLDIGRLEASVAGVSPACGEGILPLRLAGILPAIRGRDARATEEQGQDALATKEQAGPMPLLVDCWRIYKDVPFTKFAYRAFGIAGQPAGRTEYDVWSSICHPDDRRRAPVLGRPAVQHPALAQAGGDARVLR